jgi:hypothetical protein
VLLLAGAPGCAGASQKVDTADDLREEAASACDGTLVAPEDGLIYDLEDGDNQSNQAAGRDGYWYTVADSRGSEFEIPSEGFSPSEGGADGSRMAVHVKGKTASGGDQAWGIELGVGFINGNDLYDASKYVAFSFKAKTGDERADREVRVSLPDVNTHPAANVCASCSNHFNKTITLSTEWQEYTIAFADMRQREGWGDPRPAGLTPAKLINLNFHIGGGKDFDTWVDDIKFLQCKKN